MPPLSSRFVVILVAQSIQDLSCSHEILLIHLAEFSDPERAALRSPLRSHSAACCPIDGIGLFDSIIISWLNHFSLRFRLGWLPVLRLSLTLPLRLQGLGTGCWLDFTVQGFPAVFHKLTNDSAHAASSGPLTSSLLAAFAARTHKSILSHSCGSSKSGIGQIGD